MSILPSTPSRRTFLKGTGAALLLPWLDATASRNVTAAEGDPEPPRRMVAIMTDLGVIPEYFFPEEGSDAPVSPYLDVLKSHRKRMTVFSGVSHPEVTGGHQTDLCFLTGAPHPRKPGFRNSVSLDQYAAARLGPVTRYPALTLRVGPSNKTLSYTPDGVAIPSEHRPSLVFKKLFLQGSPAEVKAQIARLREGRSLMDQFSDRLKTLKTDVGTEDRQRLDQYLTALRDVEQRLVQSEEWEQKPKPEVDAKLPQDNLDPAALVDRTRAMYDLTRLALETDSTRLATIFITQQFNPKVDLPGVEVPHHALTHQMSLKDSREQLRTVEAAQFAELNRLASDLAVRSESGRDLLDSTSLLYGSNLGNAARHDTRNLPVMLLGGGFRHRGHLAYDRDNNAPLANVFVSMLQKLGIETDQFATASGPVSELM